MNPEPSLVPISSAVLGIWALVIALTDVQYRRVPNWLVVIVLVPAVAWLVVARQGVLLATWKSSLEGFGFAVLLTGVGYLARQLGAGDVKYSALLGFLAGIAGIKLILLVAALVIGLLSLAALIEGRWRNAPARKVPAALALSLGFVMFLAGV